MDQSLAFDNPKEVASEIDAEIRALPVRNTPNERAVRCKYSRMLKQANPEFILGVAGILLKNHGYRGLTYELIENHRAAFQRIGEAEVEELGQGINSWWSVDSFARTLAIHTIEFKKRQRLTSRLPIADVCLKTHWW